MSSQFPHPGRPLAGFGHYLRDVVYGALDGVVTTLAVVAGAAGANLEPRVAIILGVANLVADGLSMGASNYLALKSELQQARRPIDEEAPWRHGLATAASFAIVGCLPLFGYALAQVSRIPALPTAGIVAFVTLGAAGAVRAPFVNKSLVASAAEMLAIGAAAASAAYGAGALAELWIGIA